VVLVAMIAGLYAVLEGSQGFPESVLVVLLVEEPPLQTVVSYALLVGSQGFPESVLVVAPAQAVVSYAVLVESQGFPESVLVVPALDPPLQTVGS
jgi:hypothetical protein